ncbi:basic helix-loop-helix domain-containing protein KNAG_0D04990 [Huiozyma naganishii CBS 8797]|uniref:BHLH domain-containing protein n=1 Tax=Huiozyma naganishii (strain ATCC MYA-139 / BCRC 22969 / CBS 8797 / KCTC 17520 / NBRC 10181 / NCYC 3082 / Yp74L-3) TaxID=1071383 RepID=J7RL55_HUIN7|nr:hypothetical protein KNAG_0D04990 [Kazachstania naganishii CBS 8797]CCK70238.1 hypothetical protein KNAG_0D04990 [Kazachstania naganishii CBS 8797]
MILTGFKPQNEIDLGYAGIQLRNDENMPNHMCFEQLDAFAPSTATSSSGEHSPLTDTLFHDQPLDTPSSLITTPTQDQIFISNNPLFTSPTDQRGDTTSTKGPRIKREDSDDVRLQTPKVTPTAKTRTRASSNASSPSAKSRKRLTKHQKEAHNKIEKRYRININTRIAKLQQIIPWVAADDTAFEVSDTVKKSDTPGTKLNKSIILEKAVDYILYLQNNENLYELEVQRLRSELDLMKNVRTTQEFGDNVPPLHQLPTGL